MKQKTHQSTAPTKETHLSSIERFLSHRPRNADFMIGDWLRTLESDHIRRIVNDVRGMYESYRHQDDLTEEAYDLCDAMALAVATEHPGLAPRKIMALVAQLSERMEKIASLLLLARYGWVMMAERISILPNAPLSYEVTCAGMLASTVIQDRYTVKLLSLAARSGFHHKKTMRRLCKVV